MTRSIDFVRSPSGDGQRLPPTPMSAADVRTQRWMPSRFNVRTTMSDGRLVLWNTSSRSINAFSAKHQEMISRLLRPSGTTGNRSGLLGYLADRGFLVPEGTDELRRMQWRFGAQHYRSDILELILLASEDCNFRCRYCYEHFTRGTMLPAVRQAIRRLIDLRASTLRTLHIKWFGGEPLYGMDAIADLAPYFATIAERRGLTLVNHMTTNGYLLTPSVVAQLLSWRIDDFQITVDGTAENHDAHRPTREGGPTFDVIFRNLCRLHERTDSFSVMIRVNFDRDNVNALEPFLKEAKAALGDDHRFTFGFFPVGRWGGGRDAELPVCDRDESLEARTRLRRLARSIGLPVAYPISASTGLGSNACYAARPYSFVIGATGLLMKCTVALDTKEHNVVGRLTPLGELELDEDKFALWTEPAFERDAGCVTCTMLPMCQGIHCPLERIEQGRAPCPDLKRTAKRLLADHCTEKTGGGAVIAQEPTTNSSISSML